MFASRSKNKVLTKEVAGMVYLYRIGGHGWNGCLVVKCVLYYQIGTIKEGIRGINLGEVEDREGI